MTDNEAQETLDRILEGLKSNDPARCLSAVRELNKLNFNSKAILLQLEQLAIKREGEVQEAALEALSSRTSQYIASQRTFHTKFNRDLILKEIDEWQRDGLIELPLAEVLRRHYDFDMQRPTPVSSVSEKSQAAQKEPGSVPAQDQPASVGTPQHVQSSPPRLSLTQTLLSEASIKIYLYLGAFFVIASALILAALVEAARLPILAVATLTFGGVAISLRKRLSQPSFALFIVFSFLLPIDANVLKEHLSLSEPSLSVYWTVVFGIMTAIWGFSVWFYQSRFFSAVAFVSLSLAFYRAGQIFDTEAELQIVLGMLASLTGLAGTFLLRKWKGTLFSMPIFLLAQCQVLGLLTLSLTLALIHTFDAGISNGWWLLITLTWLVAVSFYICSDLLTPFVLFPWMAVAAILPLPWFFLNTFGVTQPIHTIGFWVWGTIVALASETVFRFPLEKIKRYFWPLLASSIPLFLTAITLAIDWNKPGFTFAIFALTALVFTALHFVRSRWYLWSAALLSGLCAYFTFFQLPAITKLGVPLIYQVLLASTLLVLPELFARSPLSLKSGTRWPAIAFGVLVSILGIALALADTDYSGRGAIALIVYAVLLRLHAWNSRREWLGYFAAATESLAIVYALNQFNLDLWVPALTFLAVLYYAAGFFFRRADQSKAWGKVFIHSGLALGLLLSVLSLILLKETSGWYIIVIALFFAAELFAPGPVWLEVAVETLLTISLYLILHDFHVTQIAHFLFGASLIWLGGDLICSLLIKHKRIHRVIALGTGAAFLILSTLTLLGDPGAVRPMIYFSIYAVFFGLSAFLQREPGIGYLATGFLALTVFEFCRAIHFEKWIFPLIALAALYYAVGYWLRRNQKGTGWDQTLLFSGLGLSVFTSFAAALQGDLDASIPVAIAATLFAAEAFARHNVWWALPANALYLLSYFILLRELQVDQPQFYSIGAALLGMLMHYLLTRAGSKTGAFIAGMLSQLVLLGTTYIQMVTTEKLSFFFVLFIQSMLVMIYGLLQRSRSLVITPIVFAVVGVMTVVYSALKGLGPVILVGSTGVLLLMAGITAVLMRERITRLGEQLGDWKP